VPIRFVIAKIVCGCSKEVCMYIFYHRIKAKWSKLSGTDYTVGIIPSWRRVE